MTYDLSRVSPPWRAAATICAATAAALRPQEPRPHLPRADRAGAPVVPAPRPSGRPSCTSPGCESRSDGNWRGLCAAHFDQYLDFYMEVDDDA